MAVRAGGAEEPTWRRALMDDPDEDAVDTPMGRVQTEDIGRYRYASKIGRTAKLAMLARHTEIFEA